MAGKKGMKQARPRTQEEKDAYALARIEQLLDDVGLKGKNVAAWTPIRMRAIEVRYSKLRASLASTELTDKREGWSDLLKRVSHQEQQVSKPDAEAAQEDRPLH